ncbi:DUF3558 domain-containing protein [Saccharopolyspora erythraea]|uniref:DUF3558 family protein n=1 Tax=Saccharopolyspora erythraea TaxID=1836 RepID=UPI001BA93432|nr:DUF3558 family protein [Saccharopolyspora erythraea]QUH00243.1 DUF3558 domain-containing protein [Saccharopolyspora erythraea]
MSTAAVVAFAVVPLVLGGCGSGMGSGPSPSSGTASPESGSANALAGMDPCRSFTADEAAQLGTEGPGRAKELAGSRTCRWQVPAGTLTVGFDDKRALSGLNFADFHVTDTDLAGRTAKLAEGDPGAGSCQVAFEVADSSSATVHAVASDMNNETACQLAQQVAPMVEAKLPR